MTPDDDTPALGQGLSMSRLAHATLGAPGFEKEKRELGAAIQSEIQEAKRIQEQTGCTWGEALTAAYRKGRRE